MCCRLFDAHLHLQDERLASYCPAILASLAREGIEKMVVNGSSEADWPAVLALARQHPQVIPSFGCHPWHVQERSPQWQQTLVDYLDQTPAGVGEIGLDRWVIERRRKKAGKLDPAAAQADFDLQEEVFLWQWRLAAKRNLPASLHCLQGWGRLLEILRSEPRPGCGFLLHSYGGPAEMIPPLTELGAYFSLPGYFALDRKFRQREAFKRVPPQRLLLETDAPDQLLPEARAAYPLVDPATGKPINHPANLRAVYEFAAELLGKPVSPLAEQVEENFHRLFGGLRRSRNFGPGRALRA